MEPVFLHIMTFPSSISFNVFHTSSESGRTHSSQRPPCIFSPPYLNQASPSTCNFQHCLYLLKSFFFFFSRLGKEAIFSCLARCKLSISPLNFQRSNMLISFLFLSHVLLSFSYLYTGLIIPIRFQVLRDSDDNNCNNNHHPHKLLPYSSSVQSI